MNRVIVSFLTMSLAAACAAEPASNAPIAGRWVTQSGNLEVEIAPCGPRMCGTVTKVLANRSMAAPGAEMQAADSRPALGMQILSNLTDDGSGGWDGSIYNRENAKTYACVLRALDADRLQVRPYVGLPLFGQTQVWTRAN